MRRFAVLALVLGLAACGPGPKAAGSTADATPQPQGPVFSSTGSISSIAGEVITLDHEAVPEAGLAAGRNSFQAYADVVAVSPGDPGARVAFSFQKRGDGWALTELKAR